MLNKASGVPLHIQLANLLGGQAYRKKLRPHERLPSERELYQPIESRKLELPQPDPTLVSTQTTCLDSGVMIEATRSIFNPQRYKLHMRT